MKGTRLRRSFFAFVVAIALIGAAAAVGAEDPRKEQERLTPADMALAKSMLLRRGDLGTGWKRGRVTPDDDESFSCPGFNPDFSAFTITGKGEAIFDHASGASVATFSEVYESKRQAIGDFRTGAKPAFARCLRKLLEEEAKKSSDKQTTLRVASARMVAAPRLGERSVAYRVVLNVSARGQVVPIYLDLLAFQKARSIGLVMTINPFRPIAGRRALAAIMVARTRS